MADHGREPQIIFGDPSGCDCDWHFSTSFDVWNLFSILAPWIWNPLKWLIFIYETTENSRWMALLWWVQSFVSTSWPAKRPKQQQQTTSKTHQNIWNCRSWHSVSVLFVQYYHRDQETSPTKTSLENQKIIHTLIERSCNNPPKSKWDTQKKKQSTQSIYGNLFSKCVLTIHLFCNLFFTKKHLSFSTYHLQEVDKPVHLDELSVPGWSTVPPNSGGVHCCPYQSTLS